jgi:hypothetical protein
LEDQQQLAEDLEEWGEDTDVYEHISPPNILHPNIPRLVDVDV